MAKAWVRVRNIPIEKRCTEHIAYAGALVGITLEVDELTVHKPEYARILLGCRDVEKIPPSTEGMLGQQYYDFLYEVEKVVTMGAEKSQSYTAVDSSASPSFRKKARMESYPASSMGQGEMSASMAGNFSSQNYDKGMQRLPAVAESEEEEESEEGNNTELLIETMAREHAAEKMFYYVSQSGKISCENVSEELDVEEITESPSNEINIHKGAWGMITPVPPSPLFVCHDVNTYGNAFPPLSDYVVWPSLHIVPLEEGSMEGGENCSVYTFESPFGSPIHGNMSQDEDVPRRRKQKLEKVGDVAANRMRKRNLEGMNLPNSKNQFSSLSDSAIILRASLMGVQIPVDDFATVDILRELELSRNLLHDKNIDTNSQKNIVNDGLGNVPLSLTWDDDSRDIEEPFILVQSKNKKRKNQRRKTVVVLSPNKSTRHVTRSQQKNGVGRAAMEPGRPTRVRDKPERYK
uniref:DUF4283 domain-containing protein n=1 Tax=Triticum urartu TaxID=4572 RepID=A0A8R7VDF0_TRIUA